MQRIRIQRGNGKLGKIPNISLPPVMTCPKGVKCARYCYAMVFWRLRKECREAWSANFEFFQADPVGYFREIARFLKRTKPARFRWHVSGDIPNAAYFASMKFLGWQFPATTFLAFTRAKDIILASEGLPIPENLILIRSTDRPSKTPTGRTKKSPFNAQAYVMRNEELAPPEGFRLCEGGCTDCLTCFDKPENVAFHAHGVNKGKRG